MKGKATKYRYNICRYCGKPLDQGASHCGSCGIYIFQLPSDLPGNRPWIEDTIGTCGYCSKPIPLDRKFCIYCGAPLHLNDGQRKMIEDNRIRSINCHITFYVEKLTEQEIRRFKEILLGHHLVEVTDCLGTLVCDFSFHYDEPLSPFSDGLFYRMIHSLLLDLGKEFPNLRAEADCSYSSHIISRLTGFDDMGGYMTITLSEGIVQEDDTPIV